MNNFMDINKEDIEFIIKYYSSENDMKELAKIEDKIGQIENDIDVLNHITHDDTSNQRDSYLNNFQKYFILSSLEWESKDFASFITEASNNNSDIDLLLESFLNKKLPYKKIKLYEHFNIKVFTNSNYPGIISYKNKDNIESELWKIYYSIYGEPSGNTLAFIDNKTYTKDGNDWKLDGTKLSLCDEFLIVDGIIPKMLKDKKTVYYSALYNYLPSQLKLVLDTNKTVAQLVNSISDCNIDDISEQNFDTNWLNKQEKFQRFLVEIYRRTINY